MKQFHYRLFLYFFILFSLLGGYLTFTGILLSNNNLYKLPTTKTTLLIGDSHTADGINDSNISYLANLSYPADAYIHSYRKLDKILGVNPQINTVIIGLGSHNIQKFMENEFIYKNGYTQEKIRNYFQIMKVEDFTFLLRKTPDQVIKGFVSIPKIKSTVTNKILFSSTPATIYDLNIGKYNYLKDVIDIKRNKDGIQNRINNKIDLMASSQWQIDYLQKMVQLCQQKNLRILFIRMPEHTMYRKPNEKIFQSFLTTNYPKIPFIDLRDLQLPDSCYLDMDHLNYNGATIATDTLIHILKTYQ